MNQQIIIQKGDITKLDIECIVNAANKTLLGGGGVDFAIHKAAGFGLFLECLKLHGCKTGQAKITPAYNLPCRYVLHTVGPIINGHLTKKDCDLLAGCYTSCLQLATDYHLESVAFCCISTGVFHFPNEKAAEIAIASTTDFLKQNDTTVKKVVFNVFKENDKEIYERLLGSN